MQTLHMNLTNTHGWPSIPVTFYNLCTNTWKVAKAAIKEWGWIEGRILSHHQNSSRNCLKLHSQSHREFQSEDTHIWIVSSLLPELFLLKINALLPNLQHQYAFVVSHYDSFAFHSLPLLSDTTSFGCSHGPPVLSGLTRLDGISNPTNAQWYSLPSVILLKCYHVILAWLAIERELLYF